MKTLVNLSIIVSFLFCLNSCKNSHPKDAFVNDVKKVLFDQEKAWNQGNLEEYMKGYWNNDSLKFIGKNGIEYGWKKTIENYKKSYPDKATMGDLKFDILKIKMLCKKSAFVVGKWSLKRESTKIGGIFTLLVEYIDGKWVITCDHTS